MSPGDFASQRESAVESTEPWTFDGAQGRIVRTRHHRIFTTVRHPVINERLPDFLEDAMAHYRTALGPLPAPPNRLDTYLMDTRAQWNSLTLRLLGEQGREYLRIGRGGFATRGIAVFYDIGVFDTLAIAGHEGWHQYTQRAFRNPLPVWLEEGIATFMEGHRWDRDRAIFLPWSNIERFDRLRDAMNADELIPLPELLSMTPRETLGRVDQRGLTYYAQVWALVHFLNEGDNGAYSDSLRLLLSDAAAGRMARKLATHLGGEREARAMMMRRAGDAVFLTYFNEDLDATDRAYRDFIRQIVRPGGRDAVVSGRSPVTGTAGTGGSR
ncbi:MAG: DUF1570 domain-containing protein [Phycisphaeraceae bacterium]|nr:MAG: DUF1570 domain-containing protein [Phycisphaeraceae bacterium]